MCAASRWSLRSCADGAPLLRERVRVMKRKIPVTYLRVAAMLLFFALVLVGLATNLAPGTPSSFGFGSIAAICPLGSLEVLIASKTFIPLAVASLACLIIIAFVLGKVFWVCPVPLSLLLAPKKERELSREADDEDGDPVLSHPHPETRARPRFDSRFAVLLGALGSTAVFGFPVFCLVCPIGLTFCLVIGLWRLIGFNEPSWLLIVFPLLLALELFVFRRWCHKICPLGAIMSLASSLNTRLRPHVDRSKCLRTTEGIACTRCKDVCFEEINLHDVDHSRPLCECTKCKDCSSVCPVGAISFGKTKQPRP